MSKKDRNGNTIGYAYDELHRLIQKSYPDSTAVNYVYDISSNITQVTDPTGTYGLSYDFLNRLTGTSTQYSFLTGTTLANKYAYDAASNRVSYANPQGGVTSYAYTTLNQLSTSRILPIGSSATPMTFWDAELHSLGRTA